jgi:hypothetical protein
MAPANVPTQTVFSPSTAAPPHGLREDENARVSRPASPRKDESGDTRMGSPSPDRSGRISPSRRTFRTASPSRPSPIVLDPIETPLTTVRPFPSPTTTRSYSTSHLPQPAARRSFPLASPAPPRPQRLLHSASQSAIQPAIKTSHTHPIHISSMLPPDLLAKVSSSIFAVLPAAEAPAEGPWHVAQAPDLANTEAAPPSPQIGNLFLSSCPGKKVRLTGPVVEGSRSAICRDLKLDLVRAKSAPYNVQVVICCLDDAELEFLGVPWAEYEEVAAELGLAVIRIPLGEGLAPASIPEIDQVVGQVILDHTLRGRSMLVHCRGGVRRSKRILSRLMRDAQVGRAGSIAVCWYAKLGLAGNLQTDAVDALVRQAVLWLRERRRCVRLERDGAL